jgi:hypothetical protein
VEALRKKEIHDETQLTTKIDDGLLSFNPLWILMYFLQVLKKSHIVYDQTQGSSYVVFLFYR